MAAVLTRAYALIMNQPSKSSAALSFLDADDISPWAQASVQNAVELKLLQGRDSGHFVPKAQLSRAEAAVAIASLLQRTNQI